MKVTKRWVAMTTVCQHPIGSLQELEGRASNEESSSEDDWNEPAAVEPKRAVPVRITPTVEVLPLSQTDHGASKKKRSKWEYSHSYIIMAGAQYWRYVSSSVILWTRLNWCYVSSSVILWTMLYWRYVSSSSVIVHCMQAWLTHSLCLSSSAICLLNAVSIASEQREYRSAPVRLPGQREATSSRLTSGDRRNCRVTARNILSFDSTSSLIPRYTRRSNLNQRRS